LIEKLETEYNTFNDSDPIQILKMLMDEQELKAKDLVEIL
jgi:HTH-type transcriptional regulator/antitoxin HigA